MTKNKATKISVSTVYERDGTICWRNHICCVYSKGLTNCNLTEVFQFAGPLIYLLRNKMIDVAIVSKAQWNTQCGQLVLVKLTLVPVKVATPSEEGLFCNQPTFGWISMVAIIRTPVSKIAPPMRKVDIKTQGSYIIRIPNLND